MTRRWCFLGEKLTLFITTDNSLARRHAMLTYACQMDICRGALAKCDFEQGLLRISLKFGRLGDRLLQCTGETVAAFPSYVDAGEHRFNISPRRRIARSVSGLHG